MSGKKDALPDLVEAAKVANEKQKDNPPISITPGKYGFKNDDEYWDYIRKAAEKAAKELIPPK